MSFPIMLKNITKSIFICVVISLFTVVFSFGQSEKRKLIYSDNFEKTLTSKTWIPEIAPQPNSTVTVDQGKLILDTQGGVTVWLNRPLAGNVEINYDWTVIVAGGKNDRLSDLNQFWMASDPENRNLFTRNGVLEAYDSLALYYVGMGGNANTTTRFRKYPGNGERILIQEYLDKEHLLMPNHTYRIKIIVKNGVSEFWVDGEKFFFYKDAAPLTKGYFGFRSTKSRHFIDNFRVYQLE